MQTQWFNKGFTGSIHSAVVARYNFLMDMSAPKLAMDRENLINYGVLDWSSFSYNGFNFLSGLAARRRKAWNVIQSCTEAVIATVYKSKPKPEFFSIGGDWEEQQTAKELTKAVKGMFQS